MGRAIFIPVEGPIEIRDTKPSFKEVQEFVGGMVQEVPGVKVSMYAAVPSGIPMNKEITTMTLYANEEGKLIGLPVNPKGSFLLWGYFRYELVGNIVLFEGFRI